MHFSWQEAIVHFEQLSLKLSSDKHDVALTRIIMRL